MTENITDNNSCIEKTAIINKNQNDEEIYNLLEYLRVSTEVQDTKMQKEANKKFIQGKPYKIIETFEDKAKSGALGFERPAFKAMDDKLNDADGILTYAWDRISREEEFAISFMYSLRRKDKFVIESSTGIKLNFDQMQSRLLGMIKSVIAEDERLKIKRRQKDGIELFKKKNNRWGRFRKFGVSTETGKELTKEMFWKKYELYRKAKISKSAIARLLQMTRTTLYKRFKENLEKYNEIEERISLELRIK